jgi:lipopolysaccharide export system protein LptA
MTMRIFALGVLSAVFLAAAQPSWAAGSGILPGASSKDPYTVDAGKLDYFEKEQKLVYSGDVIATQGQTRVKGSAMTIYLEKGAANPSSDRQVQRIEMKGPVTVVQNGKIGTGDSALYDKTDNKWYLIGRVTLTEGSDVTQGEKLVYDLGNSTAVVDAGKQGRVRSVFVPKDSNADSKGKAGSKAPESTASRP